MSKRQRWQSTWRVQAPHSLLGHPRLAQALEEPLVVGHPRRIVGRRQLLLSQLGDGLAGDAVDREVTLERFVGVCLLPSQRERRREYEFGENVAALRPPKPFDGLIVLSLHEKGPSLHVI